MTDLPEIATKDKLGSYDAIETAKPGEPLFPIQGGDPFGPRTVLHWADLCRRAGIAEEDEKKAAHLLRKASDAEGVAWTMMAYQRGEGAEIAKAREETLRMLEAAAAAGAEQTERQTLIRTAGKLHDMAGRLVVITEGVEALGTREGDGEALRAAIAIILRVAAEVEPRRENERT